MKRTRSMNPKYTKKAEEIATRLEKKHGYVNDIYEGFFQSMQQEIVSALQEQETQLIAMVETRLRIAYKNGIVDGEQGTKYEEVVVKEALQALKPLRD